MIKKLVVTLLSLMIFNACGAIEDAIKGKKEAKDLTVASSSPQDRQKDVAIDVNVVIKLSEYDKGIDETTVSSSSFYLTDNKHNPVAGSLSVKGSTLIFLPTENLKYSTTYLINLTKKISDLDGNSLKKSYEYSFVTVDDKPEVKEEVKPETTFLEVTSTIPAKNSKDIPLSNNITVIFNDAMDENTITNDNFSIIDSKGNVIKGNIRVVGNKIIFQPTSKLTNDETYLVTITKSVKSESETSLEDIYSFSFKTVNDTKKPVFTSNDAISVQENQTVAMTLVATDDNENLTYSITGGDSSSFNIKAESGVIVFKKSPDYETKNVYTFTAHVTDSGNNEVTQDVTINILDVNEVPLDETEPVFTSSDAVSVFENQIGVITLTATDNDGSITYAKSDTADSDSFYIEKQVVRFTQVPDYETKTIYSLEVTATDSAGNKATQSITVTIKDIDESVPDTEAPVFTSNNVESAVEDQKVAIILTAIDDNLINYSISGGDSALLDVNILTGEVTFKIEADYERKRVYTFTAKATDSKDNEATKDITVNITLRPAHLISSIKDNENNPLRATVTLGADANNTLESDSSGNFVFYNMTPGTYTIKVEIDDYKTIEEEVTLVSGLNRLQNILTTPLELEDVFGTYQGLIKNAVTGDAISGVTIKVREGRNANTGTITNTLTSDSDGKFNTGDLKTGHYTLAVSKSGYISSSNNILVIGNIENSQDFIISQVLTSGAKRIVLSWGLNPRDLDSHLVRKTGSTTNYHMYYGSPGDRGGNGDRLDYDDTSSYGPETITLPSTNSGSRYTYYVHKFSGSGELRNSSAKVVLYDGNGSPVEFTVPNQPGTYWKVFDIVNGVIVPCLSTSGGCMQSSPY